MSFWMWKSLQCVQLRRASFSTARTVNTEAGRFSIRAGGGHSHWALKNARHERPRRQRTQKHSAPHRQETFVRSLSIGGEEEEDFLYIYCYFRFILILLLLTLTKIYIYIEWRFSQSALPIAPSLSASLGNRLRKKLLGNKECFMRTWYYFSTANPDLCQPKKTQNKPASCVWLAAKFKKHILNTPHRQYFSVLSFWALCGASAKSIRLNHVLTLLSPTYSVTHTHTKTPCSRGRKAEDVIWFMFEQGYRNI